MTVEELQDLKDRVVIASVNCWATEPDSPMYKQLVETWASATLAFAKELVAEDYKKKTRFVA